MVKKIIKYTTDKKEIEEHLKKLQSKIDLQISIHLADLTQKAEVGFTNNNSNANIITSKFSAS